MRNAETAEPVFPVLCPSQDSSIAVAENRGLLQKSIFRWPRRHRFSGQSLPGCAGESGRSAVARGPLDRSHAQPADPVELQLEVLGPGSLDDPRKIVNEWPWFGLLGGGPGYRRGRAM